MTLSQEQARPGATSAQLRDDIDSGRTGDKVGGLDLAAAPLGVDDEAGGAPPDPQLMAKARALETAGKPDSSRANAATPELQPNGQLKWRSQAMPTLLGVLAAAILALALLAAL